MPEVKVIIEGGKLAARPKDKRDVANYARTLKRLESIASKKTLAKNIIRWIQGHITKGILPQNECGRYRDRMIYVVNSFGQTVFTPPESKNVPALTAGLIDWLNSPASREIHPVLVAGTAHYELVRIHPFIDGNGRAARALATLILYQRNFDIKRFFALDDHYNEDRDAYYSALQYVDPVKRDLTQWLEYFVGGVAEQMEKLKNKVDNLAHDPILKRLKGRFILKERQWKLLEFIKERGRATNIEYQKLANISRETAKRDLAFLVKNGLLKSNGKGRSVFYTYLS
jgi:Fic family protein